MSAAERSDSVNEIRVLASISGAHVISFYEAFIDASILYIVTELGTHGDLQAPSHTHSVVPRPCGHGMQAPTTLTTHTISLT